MLSHVAHVIEGEIHNGGVVDVDLLSYPMQLLVVGGSTGLGGRADLRAQQQGERNGGCAGSSARRGVVMHEYAGQERSIKWVRDLLNGGDWYSYSLLTTSIATSTNHR